MTDNNTVKKTRPMTDRRFISAKLSGKTTASGFIEAHLAFLKSRSFLTPILEAYENKEVLPTPALQSMQKVLFDHYLQSEIEKDKQNLSKQKEDRLNIVKRKNGEIVSSEAVSARYTITLMCKVMNKDNTFRLEVGKVEKKTTKEVENNGVVSTVVEKKEVPAVWGAEDYASANRLADRRLFQREDSVYAVIENNFDRKIPIHIHRGDALARVLKEPKGPASKSKPKSVASLRPKMKVKQDRCSGPWNY